MHLFILQYWKAISVLGFHCCVRYCFVFKQQLSEKVLLCLIIPSHLVTECRTSDDDVHSQCRVNISLVTACECRFPCQRHPRDIWGTAFWKLKDAFIINSTKTIPLKYYVYYVLQKLLLPFLTLTVMNSTTDGWVEVFGGQVWWCISKHHLYNQPQVVPYNSEYFPEWNSSLGGLL